MKLVVIDYDSGNLRSVSRALESHGVTPLVTGDAGEFDDADALVLPGVGSGPAAMDALNQRNLVGPIRDYIASGRPFLGVCLGLQLLMDRTEEGDEPCLGVVPGNAKLLPPGLKVPHMGWNNVRFPDGVLDRHPVLDGIPQDSFFYFVHSYYAAPEDSAGVSGTTEYGIPFCSVYAKDNLVATQFHPEKSGPAGLRFYKNFIGLASG
ncbi:MAG: imidazole glycerol phosphate synthase subunit HisH [Chloroflexi bacterium]|nr:imidazole glycerol phosphate synthase subunit HisH [Chloroflexota bacterium]MCH8799492.1 imidazole glycerol phosphate synthase subunit HisH [Chloroflexota bacterium]MCH8894016.1 imidazole glycerol phosphate synthase subunit HisH [Chloroflexota bacterium]MCI0788524.1 imidazole glycerol phosphate synthase subunit HisH [Chloroflexota bacterium]MCI0810652.1 imidazole glycerol phosphate synthase subunit HisH [Chloroflexota bacterium]